MSQRKVGERAGRRIDMYRQGKQSAVIINQLNMLIFHNFIYT